MAEPQHNEVVLVHLEYLREQMDGVVARLDKQNGKLETHGRAIAVLQDRGEDSRKSGRNWGLTAGGIGSAIGAALSWVFRGAQ